MEAWYTAEWFPVVAVAFFIATVLLHGCIYLPRLEVSGWVRRGRAGGCDHSAGGGLGNLGSACGFGGSEPTSTWVWSFVTDLRPCWGLRCLGCRGLQREFRAWEPHAFRVEPLNPQPPSDLCAQKLQVWSSKPRKSRTLDLKS